jgi:P-type conjugative transfer protein TrbG
MLTNVTNFKKIGGLALVVLCLTGIAGCVSPKSNLLTHVPEEPILQAQMSPPVNNTKAIKVSYYKIRQKFLEGQSPDVKKAFLQFQKTGKAPTVQKGDFVLFPYDENQQPAVVCQPLYTCDIGLEPGEIILSLRGGDTARWIYDQIYSGEGDLRQPHAIVKPKFADISTDMVITTTKRTYHIALSSNDKNYIREAKFYYPQEMQKQLKDFHDNFMADLKQAETIVSSVPMINPALLDDHYGISSLCCAESPAWKPVRAFNDGTHVFIQMPAQLRVTDAPVLFIQGKDGSKELVNYRVKDNYYIVDELFKQAVMVTGAGDAQTKIMITYTG